MKCNTCKKCPCLDLIFLLHFIPQNHSITKLGEGSWRSLVQLHHTSPLLKQRHPAKVTQGCDHFEGIQSDCLYWAERLCHSLVAEASCCPQKNTQHTPCSYQQGSETRRTQPTALWKAGKSSLNRGRREGKWPSKKFSFTAFLFLPLCCIENMVCIQYLFHIFNLNNNKKILLYIQSSAIRISPRGS